jgi:hypothetical protein
MMHNDCEDYKKDAHHVHLGREISLSDLSVKQEFFETVVVLTPSLTLARESEI